MVYILRPPRNETTEEGLINTRVATKLDTHLSVSFGYHSHSAARDTKLPELNATQTWVVFANKKNIYIRKLYPTHYT